MYDDLKNKSILVAGGSGLIGKAIVQGFCDVGSDVINGDISSSADLYLDTHSSNSFYSAINSIKHIDIFVNATYPKDYKEHLFSYISCTEIMAAHMAIHCGGVIINMASIYGIKGPDEDLYDDVDMVLPLQYAIVKGAIIAGTQWIACTYGKYGVRAICISPGGVVDNQPKQFIERYCQKVPLGHMALPEDIVGPVLFLASDAARYVTGCNIMVDGGITAKL